MSGELAAAYKSGSQRARVVTEFWGEHNLYCPNCSSPKLNRLSHNTKASDFSCPKCQFWYQLKGQKTRLGNSVTDGAYEAMMSAIRNDETPNFYFMQYDLATWSVKNLLLIPTFAFPPSAIIKRNPLSATAQRHGWIGCNIALNRIPIEARIAVVTENRAAAESEVRAKFKRVKPLQDIAVAQRGWTLDVLNIVRRLSFNVGDEVTRLKSKSAINQRFLTSSPTTFRNEDVYAFERELESLHAGNRHIRDKIRQQLQVLRDTGFLIHAGRGEWRLP
jgi:type II restriction enzyme